jgi:hypothetical protein
MGMFHTPGVIQNVAFAWIIVAFVTIVANIAFIRSIVKQRKDFESRFAANKLDILNFNPELTLK